MLYRLILTYLLVLGCWIGGVCQPAFNCKKVAELKKFLDTNHINPPEWSDLFASRVSQQTFKLIDPQAILFNTDEIQFFAIKSKKLNNALLAGDCAFISELIPLYKHALTRAERFISELRNTPLDFDIKDTLTYDLKGNLFPTTDAELKNRWKQLAKLSILGELAHTDLDIKLIKTKYKPVAEKVYTKFLNMINRRREIAGGIDAFLFNKLLNAIAKSYDPHTEFFPASEKQTLLDMTSMDQYSFGFFLEDDPMGNVVVARIVPGSSAWNANRIHVGDIVTGISSQHMKKVDTSLYTSDELDAMIESISSELELSVRLVNGEEVTVKLTRQKIREDDNKIKSLILEDSKNRFGYIDLPIFFSKDNLTQSGCATELAKEIIKLKNAQIQGLILDLRNNGGGDLAEALDLAGIFIDHGALAILKKRNEEALTLKDSNLGTAYDGPLVIMMNTASASASELFAAAMRDHNRGILVGERTYGKGTGQSVLYLDATHKEMVKTTSFRFYSVKGTSHQGHGIEPDIRLPDMLSELDYHESSQPYALEIDGIQKKTYYTPRAPLPKDLLRDSSNQRIEKNIFFKNLEKRKKEIEKYRKGSEFIVPLSTAGFLEMNSRLENKPMSLKPVSVHYKIKLTNFDQQVTGVDNFGQETYHNLIEDVAQDFYIAEVLNILKNYIQLKIK